MQTAAEDKKLVKKSPSKKIRFQRVFTQEGVHPFDTIPWAKRDAVILSKKGEEKFRQNGVEVPEYWNDTTVNIVAEKYFRVVNGAKEISAKQMFHRIAYWMTRQATKQDILGEELVSNEFPTGTWKIAGEAGIFYDELLFMLVHGMFAFNSPVWFNVGAVDAPQGSACFIQSVRDEMGDIMDLAKKEAMLFKGGSGTGANLSPIRGSNEKLTNGGIASGPISFMKGFDAFAGAMKSGGGTRRAAKMVCLNIDHPDVEDFIICKAKAEQVAHDLYETGKYTAEFNVPGNVYEYVGFQNANNSVRVTDEFMKLVEKDGEFWTKTVKNGIPLKKHKARHLWKEIAKAAWTCGDPGLQFDTTINDWHTSPNSGRINASNPCQPAWATVLTKDGIRTFADIDVGSEIWSGKQWTKVVRKVATGIKPVYRYYTRAGIFAGTAEHRVISNGTRVEAQHAESIDTSQGPEPTILPRDAQTVVDGLVFGDGFVKISNDGHDHYPLLCVGQNDHSYFSDPEIAEFINAKPFDKTCHRVKTTLGQKELPKTYLRNIPARFLGGDELQVISFLRGLYSANGSVIDQRITLKAASFAVISQVQEMLSSIGIRSYYTTNKPMDVEFENGVYTSKESYDLNISTDREAFARRIGFIQPYKQEKLDAILNTQPAARGPKKTYDIVSRQLAGEEPVWDIEVEAEEHTYWTGGLLVSNCAEYLYLDDTACNLASLNLRKFVKLDGAFDIEGFEHACKIAITAMEAIVDPSSYPSTLIAENSHKYRTLGLGYTNLGDLLTVWGLPYDSNDGRSVAAAITAIMGGAAQKQSAELAEVCGPFEAFESNREAMLSIVKKHANAAKRIPTPMAKQYHAMIDRAPEIWAEALSLGKKHGFRNAQVTVLAPTGTISFLMMADTTGIEPNIAIVRYKKLVGGGVERLATQSVEQALQNLGYKETDIEAILTYVAEKEKLQGAPGFDYEKHGGVFPAAIGPDALRAEAHILMMGAVQPFLSGGISKTVNMPNDCTAEDIEKIYMLAWKQGLKCVAVYRDGCKLSQPISTDNKTLEGRTKSLGWGERRKLPDERKAETVKMSISGTDMYVTPGFYEDNTVGEIFVRVAKQGSTLNGIIDAWATAVSIGLQHGVPLATYVEKFSDQEFPPNGFTNHPIIRRARSIPDLVAQMLALKYAPEARHMLRLREAAEVPSPEEPKLLAGKQSEYNGPACSRCGNMTKRSGTCFLCTACGDTTGCS